MNTSLNMTSQTCWLMLVDAGCNQDQPTPTIRGGGVMVVGYTFRLTTTIITTIVTQQQGTQMAAKQDPSPTEISELCLQIQTTWTAQERMKRLRSDLRPTYTRCDGIEEHIDAEDYADHHEARERLQAGAYPPPGL